MAKGRQPRHKVSRRFGLDVYGTGGAALQRRLGTLPGGRPGGRRRRRSEYARQLEEKQKAKAIYGMAEGQFRRYFAEAQRQPGVVGHSLLQLLERRLDNVVYRLGFARTRPMARQLVSHGHVRVDGRRVTIPSYRVQPGETISLDQTAARMSAGRPVPPWLAREGTTGRVLRLPTREEIDTPVDEEQIVAFYSR